MTLEQFLRNTVPVSHYEFVCQFKHCLTLTELDTVRFLFEVLRAKEGHLAFSNSFTLSYEDIDVIISFLAT